MLTFITLVAAFVVAQMVVIAVLMAVMTSKSFMRVIYKYAMKYMNNILTVSDEIIEERV